LARRYQKEEKGAAIRKLSQALIRRGFSWDIVSAIVEEIWGEEP
jgi:SOS response regulatory protein OraA/RecX